MNSLDTIKNKYEDRIRKWETYLGLPNVEPQKTDVDFILNLKTNEIKEIETSQLFDYCFTLSQYSFFLQKKINDCDAFLKYYNYVFKTIDPNDLPKLNNMKQEFEIRLIKINYLARRIELIVQSLTNIARNRNYGGKI